MYCYDDDPWGQRVCEEMLPNHYRISVVFGSRSYTRWDYVTLSHNP